MATVTAILNKKYKSKDDSYPIVIRLIDGKKQRLHPIGYKVSEAYWLDGQVSDQHPDSDIINSVIDDELQKVKAYMRDCKLSGTPLDIDLAFRQIKAHSFTAYLYHRQIQHGKADEVEMEFKVARYLKEFKACFTREIYFHEVTQDFLRTYDAWLIAQGNIANTRLKKFEFLGKYYNNAIAEGKAKDPNPFKLYKIKATPVKKEKLTVADIKKIEEMVIEDKTLQFARDLFLFSYYCRGARFETCLLMPKTSLANGRLVFQSNKGKQHMTVLIRPKLKAIIDRYKKNNTPYIFGRVDILPAELKGRVKRSKVGSENFMVNRSLKTIGDRAEIKTPISFHMARHTLAYHLKQNKAGPGAIQDVLGHSRMQTTDRYLKALDDGYLDNVLDDVYG
jgi:site-specific recombinase XerD